MCIKRMLPLSCNDNNFQLISKADRHFLLMSSFRSAEGSRSATDSVMRIIYMALWLCVTFLMLFDILSSGKVNVSITLWSNSISICHKLTSSAAIALHKLGLHHGMLLTRQLAGALALQSPPFSGGTPFNASCSPNATGSQKLQVGMKCIRQCVRRQLGFIFSFSFWLAVFSFVVFSAPRQK
jgi:hypothetical protein